MLSTPDHIPKAEDLPVITQEELDSALKLHTMFLEGETGGARACFQYQNLSNLDFHNIDLSQADFTGSVLRGADFSLGTYIGTCFFACDFTNANLSHANFSRADLRGCYLAGANMSGTDLTNADMRSGKIMEKEKNGTLSNRERSGGGQGTKTILIGAKLTNANLSGLRANSADFTDANLAQTMTHDANFNGAKLKGANLTGTDFTGSDLTDADMNNAILSDTILESTENSGLDKTGAVTDDDQGDILEEGEKTLSELLDEHTLWIETIGKEGSQLNLSDYDLRDVFDLRFFPLTAIHAIKASFLNLDLSSASMQSSVLDGSDFRDCFMENIDLRGSRLRNVKMTRANLRGARLSPLQFKNKDKGIRLNRVDLTGSDLRFANFQGADLRDAILVDTDLTHADLTGADLRRANLTGAILNNTHLNEANLTKAIFKNESSEENE